MSIYHLDGSGGGTKGEAIKTVWDNVTKEGFKPDIISGNSIMALIQVPYAIGLIRPAVMSKLNKMLETFTLDTIWRYSPINEKGKLTARAVFRGVTGKAGLGEMSIDSVLRELVPKDLFLKYQTHNVYADCINMSVDYKSGSRIFKSMKTVDSYEDFINYSVASASIPVFAEPVCVDGKTLFDGGVRDHSIAASVMKQHLPTETISIFSRPENYDISKNSWEAKNVLEVLLRTIDIMNMEISKNDELEQKKVASDLGVKLSQGFLPNVMNGPYDVNRERLNELKKRAKLVKLIEQ